jgi:hypothetical protein
MVPSFLPSRVGPWQSIGGQASCGLPLLEARLLWYGLCEGRAANKAPVGDIAGRELG